MGSVSFEEAVHEGWVTTGARVEVDSSVRISPTDLLGRPANVIIDDDVRVEAFTILHGGTTLGRRSVVEAHSEIGKPEFGYAGVRAETFAGEGRATFVNEGTVLRSGTVVYGGVRIGAGSMVGHHSVIRTNVAIGRACQLAAFSHVERECVIGDNVRLSPHVHLTSGCILESGVFIGAGVVTINDRSMVWARTPDEKAQLDLRPPYFEEGSRVGSGAIIGHAVRVGKNALVGSGGLAVKDVPQDAVAIGVPARSMRGGK